jgi:hypothetical protein
VKLSCYLRGVETYILNIREHRCLKDPQTHERERIQNKNLEKEERKGMMKLREGKKGREGEREERDRQTD